MATVTVSFTLDDKTDRRILRWLAGQSRRQKSAAIREALHTFLNGQDVTLSDVYQTLLNINNKLGYGAVGIGTSHANDTVYADEPPDVATALDNLGL